MDDQPQTIGRLALMATHGELHGVRVATRDGGRVTIEGVREPPRSVTLARLYWLGATPLASVGELAPTAERIFTRAAEVDLEAAWRALTDHDEATAEQIARGAGLEPGPESEDAVVAAIFRDSRLFRVRGGRIERERPEAVAAAEAKRAAEAEARRRFDVGLAALRDGLQAAPGDLPDEAGDMVDALIDRAVNGPEGARAAEAERLLGALDRQPEDAFDVLVELGVFDPHENLPARRAGIRRAFPPDVEAAAEAVAAAAEPRAVDLRDLLTVAIDDALTTEVDDAFAVLGERLYVFIADAARFVPRGGALDAEAARRGSTLYLPEGKVPMLPSSIGSGAASLVEGARRTALCFSYELGPSGTPIAVELCRAVITVDRQLEYTEVDRLLAADPDADPLTALLHRAREWMDRHQAMRRSAGATFIQRNEVYLDATDPDAIVIRRGDPFGPGRQLVSEMMIATCAAAAQLCVDHQIPCIFRAQAAPEGAPEHGGERIVDPASQYDVLRRLKPSTMGTRPARHFTLAVDAYCQLTSPLRRYTDLVMHQQLAGWLRSGFPPLSSGDLEARARAVESAVSAIRRVEAESRRFWALRWLEAHPGAELTARAVREAGRRWIVEIMELAIQVPMALPRRPVLGEPMTVVATRVDARADRLTLKPCPSA